MKYGTNMWHVFSIGLETKSDLHPSRYATGFAGTHARITLDEFFCGLSVMYRGELSYQPQNYIYPNDHHEKGKRKVYLFRSSGHMCNSAMQTLQYKSNNITECSEHLHDNIAGKTLNESDC